MLKFVLLLFAVAGFNARPLQHNDLRIQNGGWVIGAPQLVQNGQEYMGNPTPVENQGHNTKSKPQLEIVLAPVDTVKMRHDLNQNIAPIDESRQGTESSKRFVVDLNTVLLKEYSDMDKKPEVYNPSLNPEFRQGTQDSRVTLVNIRTGRPLPRLSEMQRRAEPLSEFRQGTEYREATLKELRKDQMMNGREKVYNPASNSEFRQGTQDSHVTLVNIKSGQPLPQLSEMQRRAEPLSEFRQGTEDREATLKELKEDQMMNGKDLLSNSEFRRGTQDSRVTLVDIRTGQQLPLLSEMERKGEPDEFRQGTEYSPVALIKHRNAHVTDDGLVHTVQDLGTNEVLPEFKRGIQYSQAQRQHNMDHIQALESNKVDISSPMEELSYAMEYSHANIMEKQIMEHSYVKESEDVSTCHGEVIAGKCYIFIHEEAQNW